MGELSSTVQQSFNGGEVSPRLLGRLDQQLYFISVAEMTGFHPVLQGAAVAMTGTRFVDAAKGQHRLLEFEYSPTQGYVIEASAGTFRFYTNNARLETSPGVPVEVAHPYSAAQIDKLDVEQSFDVAYLTGGGVAPRQLTRTGAASFSLAVLNLRNGPIGDGNSDEAITVGVSGETGAIELYASAAIFKPGHVGALFELEAADTGDIPAWEPGIQTAINVKRTYAGRVYQAVSSGRTGSSPPIHDEGDEWDGMSAGNDINDKGPYGIKWRFLHGRVGLARITSFQSSSIVNATVIKRFASSLITKGSWRWSFGAFSDADGWPDAAALWDECLVLFRGATGYVSVVGDLNNFDRRDSSGDFQRDLGGSFTLPVTAAIRWGVAERQLLIGTDRGEYSIERVVTQGAGAGPPVFAVKDQGSAGVAPVKPVKAAGRVLFLQRARRELRELAFSFSADRYTAPDLARLAEHLIAAGVKDMAWAAVPAKQAWFVMRDGTLSCLTYDPDQEVMGWSRRILGGGLLARTIARVTDPNGEIDQIWLGVEDPASGQNWVLRMETPWQLGDVAAKANFTDAGLQYSGPAVQSGTGLAHLAGRTVTVLADGKPHRDIVVGAGGSWVLDYPASTITIGLPFPARVTTLPLGAAPGRDAAVRSSVKRIAEVRLRLLESAGLSIAVQGLSPQPVPYPGPQAFDTAQALFTGEVALTSLGAFERDGQVTIERTSALPATIVGLTARTELSA